MQKPSDQELLGLIRNGKDIEKAFRLIVEKYQERLYWLIRRYVQVHEDADDVLQNTFIKVWRGLGTFRSDSELFTWIYRIAVNEAISHRNQQIKRMKTNAEEFSEAVVNRVKADSWYDGDALYDQLIKAIEQLPEKQKLVFEMKYFQEMKYEEMSKILNTSVGALKASYHHATKKIHEIFDNED